MTNILKFKIAVTYRCSQYSQIIYSSNNVLISSRSILKLYRKPRLMVGRYEPYTTSNWTRIK